MASLVAELTLSVRGERERGPFTIGVSSELIGVSSELAGVSSKLTDSVL